MLADIRQLGNEINHDVADVMLMVKPQTYRRWLSPKAKTLSPKPAGRPARVPATTSSLPIFGAHPQAW